MSEKQFNHIENRVKQAAESHEPPFDELSWKKMEAMLDKDKDRKRPFFWVFLPLAVAILTAGYFFLLKPSNNQTGSNASALINKTTSVGHEMKEKTGNQKVSGIAENNNVINSIASEKNTNNENRAVPVSESPSKTASVRVETKTKTQTTYIDLYDSSSVNNGYKTVKNKRKSVSSKGKVAMAVNAGETTDDDKAENKDAKPVISIEPVAEADKSKADVEITLKDSINKTAPESLLTKNKKDTLPEKNKVLLPEKKVQERNHGFYLLASLGAEASTVKLSSFKNSPVVPRYGIGLGYQLNKKLAVQTGFYASSKKYLAGPGDYKPGAGSYWNNVQIIKVDANCLVYEIPVTLRYDFIQKPSTSFYTAIGLSSYIMKKEKYDYTYLVYNYPYQGKYDYSGNKSFFSILSFSAGIEKNLNSSFSLLAEPSVNIPLAGVGDGNVRLYSVGLHLGIKYFFRKK